MKNIFLKSLFAAAAALTVAGTASATILNTSLAVDNGYQVYISTSNTVAGTQFGSGNDWTSTYTASTVLAANTDYFLHIYAYDQGGIAAMLGEFSLIGPGHKFSNGQFKLLTNNTNFSGNNSGFGSAYGAVVDLGADGSSPWGFRPGINDSARWIWAGDANNNDRAYFSTKISATHVPEPGSIALLGLGILGLGLARRKRAQ